jgi:hypothetical protein
VAEEAVVPGQSYCQSRRRRVRYQRESIQLEEWWEKQDFTQPLDADSDSDEDETVETVLGAGGRYEDEDDEADQDREGTDDEAAKEGLYVGPGHGAYDVPSGWEVVPKAEAQQQLTAVTQNKVYTRRWKIASRFFGHGWDEGNVRKKMSKGRGAKKKTLYDVNYPSDGKSVPHLLSFTGTEQYGAGGWEAQPREVWVVIRLFKA